MSENFNRRQSRSWKIVFPESGILQSSTKLFPSTFLLFSCPSTLIFSRGCRSDLSNMSFEGIVVKPRRCHSGAGEKYSWGKFCNYKCQQNHCMYQLWVLYRQLKGMKSYRKIERIFNDYSLLINSAISAIFKLIVTDTQSEKSGHSSKILTEETKPAMNYLESENSNTFTILFCIKKFNNERNTRCDDFIKGCPRDRKTFHHIPRAPQLFRTFSFPIEMHQYHLQMLIHT